MTFKREAKKVSQIRSLCRSLLYKDILKFKVFPMNHGSRFVVVWFGLVLVNLPPLVRITCGLARFQ